MWVVFSCVFCCLLSIFFFFFNDPATTEIYTLSLHDALPIWPTEPHQIQLYAEVAKAVQAAGGRTEPSRLLEVCCGRGGGLAYLHATLSPEATIGIDRSLSAIRHGRSGNAAIAHLQGHALQLPLSQASIDLAVNVEALADVQ